jgi:hypothetical protein
VDRRNPGRAGHTVEQTIIHAYRAGWRLAGSLFAVQSRSEPSQNWIIWWTCAPIHGALVFVGRLGQPW